MIASDRSINSRSPVPYFANISQFILSNRVWHATIECPVWVGVAWLIFTPRIMASIISEFIAGSTYHAWPEKGVGILEDILCEETQADVMDIVHHCLLCVVCRQRPQMRGVYNIFLSRKPLDYHIHHLPHYLCSSCLSDVSGCHFKFFRVSISASASNEVRERDSV